MCLSCLTFTFFKGLINEFGISKLVPQGLKDYVFERWTLCYLKQRLRGNSRVTTMAKLASDLIAMGLGTRTLSRPIFLELFHNFWKNIVHLDRLDASDPNSKVTFYFEFRFYSV